MGVRVPRMLTNESLLKKIFATIVNRYLTGLAKWNYRNGRMEVKLNW